LIGAGIFAKDVYAKVFGENKEAVALKAVWSRSAGASQEYVSKISPEAIALHGEEGLQQILADPDIRMLVVVLPPAPALEVVSRALAAGKHVIEEKPVAPTLQQALQAIQQYRALQAGPHAPLWMFAENYRYEGAFREACALAPSLLGTLIKLDLLVDLPMDSRNKYYGSQWRRDTAACPGGMLMESSVHFIAALRMLAHSLGLGEAASVSARSTHARPDLSGPDAVVGTVSFAGGSAPASVSITLAAAHVHFSLRAVGTAGTLEVSRGGWGGSRTQYQVTWVTVGDSAPQQRSLGFSGVGDEFKAFIDLVRQAATKGVPAVLGSPLELVACPEEGARDLALLEALLLSGARGGERMEVVQVPQAGAAAK